MKSGLSKSKVLLGMQCDKALYLSSHQPELADRVSDSQQLIFNQGQEVGALARTRFPGGILIDVPHNDSALALEKTREAILGGALSIYEATFEYDSVLVKVDILTRKQPGQPWQLIEVKSTTEPKDIHIPDAAIQVWVCRNANIKVGSASIMHINNQCEFPDLNRLFSMQDVSNEVEALMPSLPNIISNLRNVLQSSDIPKTDIGPQCDDPYTCRFKSHCWSSRNVPQNSVFDVPRLSTEKKWAFYREGKLDLRDLDISQFNSTQKRMIESTTSGKRFINFKGIKNELMTWTYPLSFLDFETIAYAIPKFDGQHPYQQTPFQFSCHIRTTRQSKLEHCEYLHTEGTDPREPICLALIKMVPPEGSVVAYNMGFEKGVLEALAEDFPQYRRPILAIAERLVDPLPIFRAHVYDPKFNGSFSIKEVAPAILGTEASYEELSIKDGTSAQVFFLELVGGDITPEKKAQLKKDLVAYCTKDTLGMALLVDWLFEQAKVS